METMPQATPETMPQATPETMPQATSAPPSGGGNIEINPWVLGRTYPEETASVGNTITFTWPEAVHGLYRLPTADCPSTFQNGLNGQESLSEGVQGPKSATYTFQQPGTYWFACPVDSHCLAGMHVKVTVT